MHTLSIRLPYIAGFFLPPILNTHALNLEVERQPGFLNAKRLAGTGVFPCHNTIMLFDQIMNNALCIYKDSPRMCIRAPYIPKFLFSRGMAPDGWRSAWLAVPHALCLLQLWLCILTFAFITSLVYFLATPSHFI